MLFFYYNFPEIDFDIHVDCLDGWDRENGREIKMPDLRQGHETAERNLTIVGFGWERADPSRILQSFVREHFRIHYITSGVGYLEMNGQKYRLTEGYGFIIYPGVASHYYPDQKNPWEYFWIGASGLDLQEYVRTIGLSRAAPLFQISSSRKEAKMNLMRLYASILDPELQEHDTWEYLHMFLDHVIPSIRTRHSQTYYFERCLHYIHENYARDIRIGDIAAALAIDRTYLFKLFKQNISCSPQQYLINHRIAKACDLLVSTSKHISDIAYEVGFNDLSDFSKQFKKRNGVSAREYREISDKKQKGRGNTYF